MNLELIGAMNRCNEIIDNLKTKGCDVKVEHSAFSICPLTGRTFSHITFSLKTSEGISMHEVNVEPKTKWGRHLVAANLFLNMADMDHCWKTYQPHPDTEYMIYTAITRYIEECGKRKRNKRK
jgi:hypothetical protein